MNWFLSIGRALQYDQPVYGLLSEAMVYLLHRRMPVSLAAIILSRDVGGSLITATNGSVASKLAIINGLHGFLTGSSLKAVGAALMHSSALTGGFNE